MDLTEEVGLREAGLSAAAAALLISTVSRTRQQAMLTVFLYFMPAVLLMHRSALMQIKAARGDAEDAGSSGYYHGESRGEVR